MSSPFLDRVGGTTKCKEELRFLGLHAGLLAVPNVLFVVGATVLPNPRAVLAGLIINLIVSFAINCAFLQGIWCLAINRPHRIIWLRVLLNSAAFPNHRPHVWPWGLLFPFLPTEALWSLLCMAIWRQRFAFAAAFLHNLRRRRLYVRQEASELFLPSSTLEVWNAFFDTPRRELGAHRLRLMLAAALHAHPQHFRGLPGRMLLARLRADVPAMGGARLYAEGACQPCYARQMCVHCAQFTTFINRAGNHRQWRQSWLSVVAAAKICSPSPQQVTVVIDR